MLRPLLIGSAGILVHGFLCVLMFLVLPFGWSLLICGFPGFFALLFFLVRFTDQPSPLAVLIVMPAMLTGWLGAEWVRLQYGGTARVAKPSDLARAADAVFIQIDRYAIRKDLVGSFSRKKKQEAGYATYKVYPVVDAGWHDADPVPAFCYADVRCEDHCAWAIRRTSHNDEISGYEEAAKNALKNHAMKPMQPPAYLEFVNDREAFLNRKLHTALGAFSAVSAVVESRHAVFPLAPEEVRTHVGGLTWSLSQKPGKRRFVSTAWTTAVPRGRQERASPGFQTGSG